MILGVDPMYILIGLVVGMICVVLLMSIIMVRMIQILKGIRNESSKQNTVLRDICYIAHSYSDQAVKSSSDLLFASSAEHTGSMGS